MEPAGKNGGFDMELNEQTLSLITQANPGDFAVYRVEGGRLATLYAAPGLHAISGMSSEEYDALVRDDASAVVFEGDRPAVGEKLMLFLQDRRDIDFTYRVLHKTRGFVWVHAKARFLGEMDGFPVLLTQFSNTSRETEEHEFLLSHTIANVYVIDFRTHELLFANEPAMREWGHGIICGTRCYEYIHSLAQPCPWCPLNGMADGFAHQDACHVPQTDRWFRIDARAMNWFGREAAAVYAIDITARIRRQESLELDKQSLENILSNVPGGVCVFSERNGAIHLDYTNDGFFRTHHGSPDFWRPYLLHDTIDWIYEPDRPVFQAEFQKVKSHIRDQGQATYRVRGEDGLLHWINNQFHRAAETNGVQYYYSSFVCLDEQKDAEANLAESRGLLREAMANSDIQFFTYFPGRHRCEIYALSSRLSKLPTVWENYPDDFLAYAKASPEDADAYREMLRAIDEGADESECTVRFAYQDSYYWERMRLRAIRDAAGRIVRAQGRSLNVTEEKKARDRLQQERIRLKNLEGSILEVFSLNISRRAPASLQTDPSIQYAEPIRPEVRKQADEMAPRIQEMSDRSREILLSVANQIPGDDDRALFLRTCSVSGIRDACREGHFSQIIRYRRSIGGCLRWVSTSVEVLPDPESGDLIAFFYTRDIHNETLYRQVSEDVIGKNYLALSFYDLPTQTFHSRHSSNRSDSILSGEDYMAAIERGIKMTADPSEETVLREKYALRHILQELETKPSYTFYYTGRDRNETMPGRPRRRLKNESFYLNEDRTVIVMLLTNVTEIFEQEQDNREKMAAALAAAEQASLAKTEFLSRMSHEIRTPMNAIIGLDAIALQEKGLSDAMEDHLQKIGISARFLLSLINDILDMSRIESGRMILKNEPFDFEELIGSINTILYEQCRDSGLDYDCVLKSYTEDTYVGDKTKLQQVLVNILGNAVKFTPKGGKIRFLIEQTSRTKDSARLRFEISDTGIGIDEKFIPHLFEAFSQENRGRTSAYGGTGLGLAICKNIVSLMGGEIRVHSIKNVGTEFTVEISLGLSRESIRRRELMTDAHLTPLFTLIVDDDVIVCRHTQRVLLEAGLRAEWVESGTAAVEQVALQRKKEEDYDLILLDWKMPDMDGIETARQLRKIVGPEVTIIIMTAYDWTDIEQRAREAGVDLFMKKPLFASSVVKAFEHVFRGRAAELDPACEPEYDFAGRRFLLAEDNEINAEIARSILEMKNAAVDLAENGVEAIEAFTTAPVGHYDAILMDVRMPVMDGLEAARAIRAMKKADGKTVPIIAMTANAFQEDVNASLESGMNAHLAKPIDPQALYETLERHLRRRG